MKPQKLTQLKVGSASGENNSTRATFEEATIWSKFAYCQVRVPYTIVLDRM